MMFFHMPTKRRDAPRFPIGDMRFMMNSIWKPRGFKSLKKWRKYGLKRGFKFTTSIHFEDPNSFKNDKDWDWLICGISNEILRPQGEELVRIMNLIENHLKGRMQ